MGNNVIIRLNDIDNEQEKAIKSFLEEKGINYDKFDSAYELWNEEEAEDGLETMLSQNYNTENINIHDFVKDNKKELANILIENDDLVDDGCDAQYTIREFIKDKGIKEKEIFKGKNIISNVVDTADTISTVGKAILKKLYSEETGER